MRRGIMAVFLAAVLMTGMAMPVCAAEEQGTVRVVMPPELAGKTATLYLVIDTGAGEMELAGQGWSKELSKEGTVMFTGLAEGMYLVAVEDILAVPVSLPETDGSWMAEIVPEMVYIAPSTGQPAEPVMWTVWMMASAFGICIWCGSGYMRKKR